MELFDALAQSSAVAGTLGFILMLSGVMGGICAVVYGLDAEVGKWGRTWVYARTVAICVTSVIALLIGVWLLADIAPGLLT